jgi:hypothetical protein
MMRMLGIGADVSAHVKWGIPFAAAAHTLVQWACGWEPWFRDMWMLPIHTLLGIVFGSIITGPAFLAQGFLTRLVTFLGAPRWLSALLGGVLQASFVAAWAVFVGLEPSLEGRCPLTGPMLAAAFCVGTCVGLIVTRRRPPAAPATQ